MNDSLGNPQSAIIFGADSDIAKATMELLIKRRCKTLYLGGRNIQALEQVAKLATEYGATKVNTFHFDATEINKKKEIIEKLFSESDGIDLALIAFGILGNQSQYELDIEKTATLMTTNYIGSATTGLLLSLEMKSQGYGNIVVLSSVAAERARKENFIYGSSKAAMDVFFQGLGDSLQDSPVRVMIVRPGFVHTKMTQGMKPFPFSSTPESVAKEIISGLEAKSEMIWAPPILRWVMSVVRHLPRFIYRKIT